MLRFFIAMRQLIAQGFGIALGEIPLTVIDERWLPALNAKLENSTDYANAEKLMNVIELWQDYANGGSKEGLWNNIAKKAVLNVFRGNEQAAEEAAADITSNLWEDQSFINRFDPENGPQDFLRLWTAVVNNQAKLVRRQNPQLQSLDAPPGDDDRNPGLDEKMGLPAPLDEIPEVDQDMLLLLDRDLRKYVERKARNDQLQMDVFNGWVNAVRKKKSLHKVMPFREVFPDIIRNYEEAGKTVGRSTLGKKWQKLQVHVVNFFEDELGREVGKKLKEKLKMSAEDVLAFEEYRRRFSAWMLQPIFHLRAKRAKFRLALALGS